MSLGSDTCLCVFSVFSPGVKHITYNRGEKVKGAAPLRKSCLLSKTRSDRAGVLITEEPLRGGVCVSHLNHCFLVQASVVPNEQF